MPSNPFMENGKASKSRLKPGPLIMYKYQKLVEGTENYFKILIAMQSLSTAKSSDTSYQ